MNPGHAGTPDGGEDWIFGIHPVMEELDRGGRRIERVLVIREARGGRLGRILRQARRAGVPVSHVPREVLARRVGRQAVHQGVAALVSPMEHVSPDEILEASTTRGSGLVLAIDGIEDPRNLGAVLRSAAAAGVDGVILARDATVGVTAVAVKASAGLAVTLRIAREARMSRRLESMAEAGFSVVGLDPRADRAWDEADLSGRVVLVAGGEGRGLRPGLLKRCNERVAIPLATGVDSLNVSVAVGVVLFEVVRQRRQAEGDRNSDG